MVHQPRGAKAALIQALEFGFAHVRTDRGDADEAAAMLLQEIQGDRIVESVGTAVNLHAARNAERSVQGQPCFARAQRRRVFTPRRERIALEAVEDMRVAIHRAARQGALGGAQAGVRCEDADACLSADHWITMLASCAILSHFW